MSTGLYSGQPGLSLGTGLYRTVSSLWSGASGLTMAFGGSAFPANGLPTLVIDFVLNNPEYDNTLSLDFTTQQYISYATDPATTAPVNIQVWS